MNKHNHNIWKFQANLSRRLLAWSSLSMVVGALLQIPRNRFLSGMGQQFAAWGLIDALIAIFGERAAKMRADRLPDPLAPEIIERESHKLQKLLWVNACLDVGYAAGGSALALIKGKNDRGWRGHGIGVVIQGAFLFFFDIIHAIKIGSMNRF